VHARARVHDFSIVDAAAAADECVFEVPFVLECVRDDRTAGGSGAEAELRGAADERHFVYALVLSFGAPRHLESVDSDEVPVVSVQHARGEHLRHDWPTSAPAPTHIFCTGTGLVTVQMWATSATGDHVITAAAACDKHHAARVMLRVRPRLPIACTIESEYTCSADDGRVLAGKGSVRCRQHLL
jgi:hypothetical protein